MLDTRIFLVFASMRYESSILHHGFGSTAATILSSKVTTTSECSSERETAATGILFNKTFLRDSLPLHRQHNHAFESNTCSSFPRHVNGEHHELDCMFHLRQVVCHACCGHQDARRRLHALGMTSPFEPEQLQPQHDDRGEGHLRLLNKIE